MRGFIIIVLTLEISIEIFQAIYVFFFRLVRVHFQRVHDRSKLVLGLISYVIYESFVRFDLVFIIPIIYEQNNTSNIMSDLRYLVRVKTEIPVIKLGCEYVTRLIVGLKVSSISDKCILNSKYVSVAKWDCGI